MRKLVLANSAILVVLLLAAIAAALEDEGLLEAGAWEGRRTVTFVLRDPDGTPLPGGKLVREDERYAAGSRRTGIHGRGQLDVRASTRSVTFMAPYREAVTVALPEATDETLDVRLQECAGVDVRILLHDGSPAAGLRLALWRGNDTSTENSTTGLRPWDYGSVGASRRSIGIVSEEGRWEVFEIDSDGSASLFCLEAGRPYRLDLAEGVGADAVLLVGMETEPFTLREGEQRSFELRVPTPGHPLEVEVRGPQGRLEDASVTLISDRDQTRGGVHRTGVAGVFQFQRLHLELVHLLVTCPGYASRWIEGVELGPDGRRVEVELEPERPLRFELVDPSGAPVKAWHYEFLTRHPEASVPDWPSWIVRTESRAGSPHWLRLPAEGVKIRVRVGLDWFEAEWDGSTPSLRVDVPAGGKLVAHAPDIVPARHGSFGRSLALYARRPGTESSLSIGWLHAKSDARTFEAPPLPAGDYDVHVRDDPGGRRTRDYRVTIHPYRTTTVTLAP